MEWSVLLSRVRAAMLVFGFFLLVSALSTAQSAKNEEPMLTATLASDKTNYSLADDIRLDVRVTNAGKSPVTVFGELLWGYAEGLANTFEKVTLGPDTPVGGSPEEMAAAGTRAAANQYIVSKGLVVPLRSSIFRGLDFAAESTEILPLAQLAASEWGGAYSLGKSQFVDRSCQMP